MNNSVSFQSKINFMNPPYTSLKCLDHSKYVGFDLEGPLYVASDAFHTRGIRTCVGGGFTNGISKALGIHWLDDMENYFRIGRMCDCVFNVFKNENINGLIVGGKDLKGRSYSLSTLDAVIDYFMKKVKNLTVFREHIDTYGETSYMYNLKEDTWTLSTGYTDKNGCYHNINCLEDLRKCYRQISIADNDVLCINGTEIPKEQINAF